MRKLNDIELNELALLENVIPEDVVRPEPKYVTSKKQKINNEFASISSELTSYTVAKDDVLRDIHKTVYGWKNEDKELIKEIISSYCPVKMTLGDVSILVDNAVSI